MKAVSRYHYTQRGLWLWVAVLALLLVWVFLPLATQTRWWLTLAVLVGCGLAGWWATRQTQSPSSLSLSLEGMPDNLQGALVLVCGDIAGLFAAGETCRITRQGCYLAVPTPESLRPTVQGIASTHPDWLPKVSLMLSVVPECHRDEDALRSQLHHWRSQVAQCRALLKREPPLLLCGYFPVPNVAAQTAEWFADDGEGTSVWTDDFHARPFDDWLQSAGSRLQVEGRFVQAVWLAAAQRWLKSRVLDELHSPQTALPVLNVNLLAVNLTLLSSDEGSLWQQFLQHETTLSSPQNAATDATLPFPDPFLPQLPHDAGLTPVQRGYLWGGVWLAVFIAAALLASFINNQRLIRSVGDDLAHYRQLSGTPPEPKLAAQQRLREDEQLLARYQRQGAPLPLGLGLYRGEPLYPVVQKAVSDWAPPPPPVIEPAAPQTVRLDSLSLFDTGSATLKPGSTKVLVDALINIKAKPGWLILVSGHTDSTGNEQNNQTLSLKRADAVRDWMLHTSDVPATCFAVQGYGATRPLASNDSAPGRAANRRVEISLVPQADACQAPAALSPESVTLSRQ